jgi:hypothetical protein
MVAALEKSRNLIGRVIPLAKPVPACFNPGAGIQLFQDLLDPSACPGPYQGVIGMTPPETSYETMLIALA